MKILVPMLSLTIALSVGPAWAESQDRAEPREGTQSKRASGQSVPQTTMDYADTNAMPERFEGKVVCLRSNERIPPAEAGECSADDRTLAIAVLESDTVEPIIAADDKTRDLLVERIGERVVIEGKRYEATGQIMASTVLSAAEAK